MKLGNGERANGPSIMQRLGYERYRQDMYIYDLADKIGITERTLSRYELEVNVVPFWVVEAICKELGLKLIIFDKKGNKIYENA